MEDDYLEACLEGNSLKVKTRLDNGDNPNTTDNDGWSGLHIAASKGFVPLINVLMDNGADIELENPNRTNRVTYSFRTRERRIC